MADHRAEPNYPEALANLVRYHYGRALELARRDLWHESAEAQQQADATLERLVAQAARP